MCPLHAHLQSLWEEFIHLINVPNGVYVFFGNSEKQIKPKKDNAIVMWCQCVPEKLDKLRDLKNIFLVES